ncbi:MAG: hypothetical protein KDA65_02685 [Planctomycetaceae bacterium]|nr:hypothetical protein [Planctomycetaceae bacterium]
MSGAGENEWFVLINLNHKINPLDRGDRYEDPLDDALQDAGLGELNGGGTAISDTGEVTSSDIELTLYDLQNGVPFVIAVLTELGAPKGSKLVVMNEENEPQQEFHIGTVEGVALRIKSDWLDESSPHAEDFNTLLEELMTQHTEDFELQGSWEGEDFSELYFYGASAAKIRNTIESSLKNYSFGSKCELRIITPVGE